MKGYAYNWIPAGFIYVAADSLSAAARFLRHEQFDVALLHRATWLDPVAKMAGEREMGRSESGGAGVSGEEPFRIAYIARDVFWAMKAEVEA